MLNLTAFGSTEPTAVQRSMDSRIWPAARATDRYSGKHAPRSGEGPPTLSIGKTDARARLEPPLLSVLVRAPLRDRLCWRTCALKPDNARLFTENHLGRRPAETSWPRVGAVARSTAPRMLNPNRAGRKSMNRSRSKASFCNKGTKPKHRETMRAREVQAGQNRASMR